MPRFLRRALQSFSTSWSRRFFCRSWRDIALAVALTVATTVQATTATAEDAVASVNRIYHSTIEAASDPRQLATSLATSVHLDAVATKILGEAYTAASAADRADFDQVLLQIIALELGRRIRSEYTFEILRARQLGHGDVVVFSRVTESNGQERLLDWKMRPCGGQFCIFDLLSNNVSFGAAQRNEFSGRLAAAGGSVAVLTQSLRTELNQ